MKTKIEIGKSIYFAPLAVLGYGLINLLKGYSTQDSFLMPAVIIGTFLLGIILHECGHLFVAKLFGLPVETIYVSLTGGHITLPANKDGELDVSVTGLVCTLLAGPLVNLTMGILALFGFLYAPDMFWFKVFFFMSALELVSFFTNMIPDENGNDGSFLFKILKAKMNGDEVVEI